MCHKFFNVSLDYLLGLSREEHSSYGIQSFLIPENLPPEAVKEITEYIEYIKTKFKNT